MRNGIRNMLKTTRKGAILELNKRETSALQKYVSAASYSLNDKKLRRGESLSEAEQRWTKRL